MAFIDSATDPADDPGMNGVPVPDAGLLAAGLPADAEPPAPDQLAKLRTWIRDVNIAEHLSDEDLGEIGDKVKREYEIDVQSRAEWVDRTQAALDLAMQRADEKSYPWPKASNVIYPLMTTAAMQFAARAYPAVVSGRNVVRGVVVGDDSGIAVTGPNGQPVQGPDGQPAWVVPPGAKRARADAIGAHMSWQLLDEMPEWEPETDRLLHLLPIAGSAFRKCYFDPGKGRNCSHFVSAMKLVINYGAKSLELAPRITEEIEFYPFELREMELSGVYLEVDYTAEPNDEGDDDALIEFLEQHRWLDLDEDGYPEPYIVTVHKATGKVVRIVARYDEEGVKLDAGKVVRIEPIHYYTGYEFLPNPASGVYGLGLGELLTPINHAINTTLNQLLDAGHLANTGGGFIGKGLSMNSGAVRFAPGEWKTVNATGTTIRDSMVPLTFPGPSAVLFNLLGTLVESGKEIASVKDVLTGDQTKANIPATTTLAMIEQGLKVFTAIYKRFHRSLKSELGKLFRLNRVYMPDRTQYQVGDEWRSITRAEYEQGSGVEPISDPQMVSDMQRLGKAQFLLQFANDPMSNGLEIRRRMLEAAQIEKPETILVPPPPPQKPPQLVLAEAELQMKAQEGQAKMQLSAAELAVNANAKRASEVRDLSQAILNLANAEKAVGEGQRQWIQSQLSVLQQQFEMAQGLAQMQQEAAQGAQQGAPVPGPPVGPGPGGMPPQGASGGNGADADGPRQAPDGNFYIRDPSRPGKYLMIMPDEGGPGSGEPPPPPPMAPPSSGPAGMV